MGIAIDGHIIWGPFKGDGTYFVGKDVDICNGGYFDSGKQHYGYTTTEFWPYFVGCWGPGPTSSVFCPSTILINSVLTTEENADM